MLAEHQALLSKADIRDRLDRGEILELTGVGPAEAAELAEEFVQKYRNFAFVFDPSVRRMYLAEPTSLAIHFFGKHQDAIKGRIAASKGQEVKNGPSGSGDVAEPGGL